MGKRYLKYTVAAVLAACLGFNASADASEVSRFDDSILTDDKYYESSKTNNLSYDDLSAGVQSIISESYIKTARTVSNNNNKKI